MDILTNALPIIFSLVVMETLLSVDNAMVLVAMVRHLGDHEQKRALRWGYIGAFVQRAIALVFASFLVQNDWVLLLGAGYLIYIMCKHLGTDTTKKSAAAAAAGSFWATVLSLQLADLSFAVDNVVAAVAISREFWVILVGVLIGMATMLMVSGVIVKLMKKFPALEPASYLLVGFVGAQLIVHHYTGFDLEPLHKMAAIGGIIAVTLIYSRLSFLNRPLGPLVALAARVMGFLAGLVDLVFWPVKALFRLIFSKRDKR